LARGKAIKRYNRTVVALSLLYVGLLFTAQISISRHGLAGAPAYVVAVLPALPIIGIFAAIGRYLVEESDEYLRLLSVRQALVASALALSVATAWGFLESFDLAAHFDAYWIAVIWFAGLGLGSCVNKVLAAREA
jgi:FtsH-binding integral membrane protein